MLISILNCYFLNKGAEGPGIVSGADQSKKES